MKKYHLIINYYRRLIFCILKYIYAIYDMTILKIFLPMEDCIETSELEYRLKHDGNRDYKIYRFKRMSVYQYNNKCNKAQKEIYRKNMETIVKISDETRIPQHILLGNNDLNKSIIVYNGKYNKQTKEYSILEPLYYIFKLLPSLKQTIIGIRYLLIYLKQRWIYYVWKRFEDPYFYHWTRRVLAYRLRGNDPKKIFFIGYRWEMQKYYRERRMGKKLRREKNIKYYKTLKNHLHNEVNNATIQASNISII